MTRRNPDRPEMVVAFIRSYQQHHGYAPSVREIMRGVGLSSPAAVHYHLQALREAGRLTDAGGAARATIPTPAGDLTADVIELAWCLSTHGSKPPKHRPCKRHRLMAEWLAEIVLPKARGLAA